ncbi:MAG: tetratricopeptide repeat protein [bacterium]
MHKATLSNSGPPLNAALWLWLLLLVFLPRETIAAETQRDERPTLAILDFADKGPSVRLARLRIALAEMLTSDLSAYRGVQVIERLRVAQLLEERNLRKTGFTNKENLSTTARSLSADYFVSGTFEASPKRIRLTAKLHRVAAKTPEISQWQLQAPPTRFFRLEQELLEKILDELELDAEDRLETEPTEGQARGALAVVGFQNLSPEARLDPLEIGFSETLHAQLSELPNIQLVDRQNLFDILEEQQLSAAELADPARAVRIGQIVGADKLVSGFFAEVNGELRIDVRLIDSKTGAVQASGTATGPRDSFTEMLAKLAKQITAALGRWSPSMDRELRGATPTHEIEAALHFSKAKLAFYRGQFQTAAENYERVLALEPNNVHAGLGRLKSWSLNGAKEKAISSGEQALAMSFSEGQDSLKEQTYRQLFSAYWAARNYDSAVKIADQFLREFPATHYKPGIELSRTLGLIYAGRRDEGVHALEDALNEADRKADPGQYVSALRSLHSYYMLEPKYIRRSREFEKRRSDPGYMKLIAQRTWNSARRASELHRLLIEEMKDRDDVNSRMWAQSWAVAGLDFKWINESGARKRLLSPQQKQRRLGHVIDAFHDAPKVVYKAHRELAEFAKQTEDWQQSLKSYRFLRDHPRQAISEYFPVTEDLQRIQPQNALELQIEAQFQIAAIQHDELGQPRQARDSWQQLIHDFGLSHHRGVNTARRLAGLRAHDVDDPGDGITDDEARVGVEYNVPEKAALVWGGGAETLWAWQRLLKPIGYMTHRLGQYRASGAHLADYDLVILVRTGKLPYEPTDILALRSFVASGGSLLVVVSPGWEPVQPGLHNSLLSLFHVHAGNEMVIEAKSTKVADHPITNGIQQPMAKCAVHLDVPQDASLIQADGKTVLAAMPYRQGRVVVSSLGQWFHPEPGRPDWKLRRKNSHWTRNVPPAKRPIENGKRVEIPLLKQVLNWLAEPSTDQKLHAVRERFSEAHRVGLDVQFQIQPREKLTAAMDRLIAAMPDGTWKEEALWEAGEAMLQLFYFAETEMQHPHYNFPMSQPPSPEPRYFQQLIDQFPKSPLHPFAQWRLADCQRRLLINAARPQRGYVRPHYSKELIESFEKVDAISGSVPWHWSRLRMGELYYRNRDFAAAARSYQQVSENAEPGAEKTLALMNLSLCFDKSRKDAEAKRYAQRAGEAPEIFWRSSSPYAGWAPLGSSGATVTGSSERILKRRE